MTISQLNNTEEFSVVKVSIGNEIGKRLAEMGFTRGAKGTIVRSALFGDPIQVNIRNYNISIRRTEADSVEVELDKIN